MTKEGPIVNIPPPSEEEIKQFFDYLEFAENSQAVEEHVLEKAKDLASRFLSHSTETEAQQLAYEIAKLALEAYGIRAWAVTFREYAGLTPTPNGSNADSEEV